jgi:hypothetical protein
MIKELEDYVDEKLLEMAKGMVACVKPEILIQAEALAKRRDAAGIVIKQDIDVAMIHLGLMIQEELTERRDHGNSNNRCEESLLP